MNTAPVITIDPDDVSGILANCLFLKGEDLAQRGMYRGVIRRPIFYLHEGRLEFHRHDIQRLLSTLYVMRGRNVAMDVPFKLLAVDFRGLAWTHDLIDADNLLILGLGIHHIRAYACSHAAPSGTVNDRFAISSRSRL